MVFNVVGTDGHDDVSVLEVTPVAGHGAASEGRSKTGNGRGVADTGLVVDLDNTERTGEFLNKPGFFAVQLCSTVARDAFAAVDGNTVFFFSVALVTSFLNFARHLVDSLRPGNGFPFTGAGAANQRLCEAVRMHH